MTGSPEPIERAYAAARDRFAELGVDTDLALDRLREIPISLHCQMGVGGNDSWGALPLDEYLLPNRNYHYRYTIRGIDQAPAITDSH